ncbi:MAG: oxaloacetate decarboxylase subunit alpha, partial [Firmicutes bacterium]|nr:oxaloacetate decarboxylase subunit alpha [Bacillota bacterium]
RPADLIKPELDKYREEAKDLAKSDEDVLSYALFPQVAEKFLAKRNAPKTDDNAVRQLIVEDISF